MKNIIKTDHLTKIYSRKKVLDNLMLQAEPGDIVGLIGPNGAGKSTAMKIIMSLIKPTEGKVMLGDNEDRLIETQKIGFASESPSFYNYLTGYENLKIVANMYENISEEKINELISFVGLEESKDQKVKTYSTGMKQRLGLARALLNDPILLVLDEPTNGLDPSGIRDIYKMLNYLAVKRRIAILLSSHQLHDVEKICNKVIMINQGKTVYNGEINDLGGSLEESYFSLL